MMPNPWTPEWRPIPGFERYDVSVDGRVRNARTGQELRATPDRQGYLHVEVASVPNQHKRKKVHALVLIAFAGPCPSGYEGAHLDGNPAHNQITNLVWATRKTNAAHREAHGRTARGLTHGSTRLTVEQVAEIRRLGSEGLSQGKIAATFRIARSHVWRLLHRKEWAHV